MASASDVVLSARVRLARNLSDVALWDKSPEACSLISSLTDTTLQSMGAVRIVISELSEVQKFTMYEKHIISKDLLRNPNAQLFLDANRGVSIMIGEEDHLRLQCSLRGKAMQKAYSVISEYDNALGKECDFMYSKRFGYLTSSLSNVGTGLRASYMSFLPALTLNNELKYIRAKLAENHIVIRGSHGESTESRGYTYQVSNENTIGKTEFELIAEVERAISWLEDEEQLARQELHEKYGDEIAQCARNYYTNLLGISTIDEGRAIVMLSGIRLADSLGVIGLRMLDYDKTIMSVSSWLIAERYGIVDEAQQNAFRAALIKKTLFNVPLAINL